MRLGSEEKDKHWSSEKASNVSCVKGTAIFVVNLIGYSVGFVFCLGTTFAVLWPFLFLGCLFEVNANDVQEVAHQMENATYYSLSGGYFPPEYLAPSFAKQTERLQAEKGSPTTRASVYASRVGAIVALLYSSALLCYCYQIREKYSPIEILRAKFSLRTQDHQEPKSGGYTSRRQTKEINPGYSWKRVYSIGSPSTPLRPEINEDPPLGYSSGYGTMHGYPRD